MKRQHVSIAAASLAALIVGIGPATAQTSNADSTGGTSSTDAISGAISGDATCACPGEARESDTQSPSASPPMTDDKVESDARDREDMKQHEQLDKKNGLDRADSGTRQ